MAPTLTSNSFLIGTTPHARTFSLRTPRLRVLAKKAGPFSPFQIGKQKDDDSENSGDDVPGNSSPFKFNFGKAPDMKSLIPVARNPGAGLSFGNVRRKDPSTVFVAGAAGQAGIRIAQTLLRQGFSVRAGVPELKAAQELALLAAKYKIISKEEANRLNAVQSTFDDAESIAKAIGNASKVVVTIGPCENGPTSEVSASDAVEVIQAAQLAGVSHVAIIYDGNTAAASTYNVLDGITSFFNNLFSQSQPLSIPEFLQKVIETDVGYTFIKTSLTEDFSQESSYNLIVSAERSIGTNDYKVAKSQIASVVADVFSNTTVTENKVVEIFTNPSAPSKSVVELFRAIPEDERRKVYAETLAKAKAEEEANEAAEKARKAADAAKKFEKEVKKLSNLEAEASSLAKEAQEKAEATGVSFDNLINRAKDISADFSWDKLGYQITNAVETNGEKLKVRVATVRGQAKARSLPSQKAVVKRPTPKLPTFRQKEDTKPKVAPKQAKETESKTEVRKVFGGLFKQETIYVDDD